MKKISQILTTLLCIVSVITCPVSADSSLNVVVDGKSVEVNPNADITKAPMQLMDMTYLPVGALAQWNGKIMVWNNDANTLTFTTPNTEVATSKTTNLAPDISELIKDYKSLCEIITFSTYTATDYTMLNGNRYVVAGEVSEVIKEADRVILGINITKTTYHYTGTVYVEMSNNLYKDDINVKDLIAVWGVFDGTYTWVLPSNTTIQDTKPLLNAKYFELYDDKFPSDIYVEEIILEQIKSQPTQNTDKSQKQQTQKVEEVNTQPATRVFGPNEKWVVDGEWELTIHSAKTHTKCNSFNDAEGYKQIVFVTYSYKNLGYDMYKSVGLRFDWTNMDAFDCNADIGTGYPCTHRKDAQYVNKGKQCTNAQETFALVTKSKEITIEISMQPNFGADPYTATFVIPIK